MFIGFISGRSALSNEIFLSYFNAFLYIEATRPKERFRLSDNNSVYNTLIQGFAHWRIWRLAVYNIRTYIVLKVLSHIEIL